MADAARAAELAERCLRQVPADRELDRAAGLELLARARTARGELEEARAALEALREIERAVGTPALRASVDLAEGLAGGGGRRPRPGAAPVRGRRPIASSEAAGRFEAAQARIELATTLVALGRTDVAEQEAASALDQLLELGAEVEAERARRLQWELSAATTPALRFGLTPREREVLGLIAEGLTNRQIAERLVVSEHTVHRHVTNILRKLDLPSRTAAAALAARLGLLDERAHSQIWPFARAAERCSVLAKPGPAARDYGGGHGASDLIGRLMAEVAALARIEEMANAQEG